MTSLSPITLKDCIHNHYGLCHKHSSKKCEEVELPCMFKKYSKETTPEIIKTYFEADHSPLEKHPKCIYSIELLSFETPAWFYKYVWSQLKHRTQGRIHNTFCVRHRKAKTLHGLKKQFSREINKILLWNAIERDKGN